MTAADFSEALDIKGAAPANGRWPQVELVSHACVTPHHMRPEHQFSGEVYRSDGTLCAASLRYSEKALFRHVPRWPSATSRLTLKGKYLYSGPIFGMFGHDICEFPGRLWPLLTEHSYDGIVCQKWDARSDAFHVAFNQTTSVVVAAFGLTPLQIHVVTADTTVECLAIPEAAMKINDSCLPIMAECYRRLADFYQRPMPHHKGFYMSRRLLGPHSRSVRGEELLEDEARRAGLTVLHPQLLALPTQIALMRTARNIVGPDGSAMHLAAFARPGTRVLSFETRFVQNQRAIEQVMQLDGRHIGVADRQMTREEIRRHLAEHLTAD